MFNLFKKKKVYYEQIYPDSDVLSGERKALVNSLKYVSPEGCRMYKLAPRMYQALSRLNFPENGGASPLSEIDKKYPELAKEIKDVLYLVDNGKNTSTVKEEVTKYVLENEYLAKQYKFAFVGVRDYVITFTRQQPVYEELVGYWMRGAADSFYMSESILSHSPSNPEKCLWKIKDLLNEVGSF